METGTKRVKENQLIFFGKFLHETELNCGPKILFTT